MADELAKETKRRVKNPETFRERAVKAVAETNKPSQPGAFRRLSGPLSVPFKQAGQALRAAFNREPLRRLRRPLRLVGKVIFPAYFRNSWQELKLVTWPNWRESRRLTGAVLIFAIIFGTVIALVDYGLDKLFKSVLLK